MYNRKAFKKEAKQLMRASVPHFMLVALVYYLLTTGLSTAVEKLTGGGTIGVGVLSIFLTILVALFSIVMGVGFSNYALRLARREETGMGSLFHAFSFTGRSLGMTLLVVLFTFLWTLLVVICFAVAVALLTLIAEKAFAVFVAAVVVLYIVVIVLIVVIALRYAMASFALVDNPDAGAMDAIRRSVRMMRGYKGKCFVLELSFIGWELLAGLIAGIVVGIGFAVSGAGWITEITSASVTAAMENDPFAIYGIAGSLMSRMSLWFLLAELVSLPLSLWLLVYEQTAAARFYNYVSGYDYHQYMNQQPSESNAPLTPPNPSAAPEQAEAPANPDDYYTSVLPPETSAEEPEAPSEEPETPAEPDEGEEI